MFGRGSFFVRLLGLLILAGLLFAGGTLIYRAGYSQGLVESPAVAQAMSSALESGQLPLYPGYRYAPLPGLWPGYGFSPFGLLLGLFFFGLLALFALRLVFRPRFRGPWGAGDGTRRMRTAGRVKTRRAAGRPGRGTGSGWQRGSRRLPRRLAGRGPIPGRSRRTRADDRLVEKQPAHRFPSHTARRNAWR